MRAFPPFARALIVSTAIVAFLCLPAAAGKSKSSQPPAEEESRLSAETFSGLALRGIGPAFMSGRIADIAIDQGDPSTWYVAVGSGGVWKTTNAGTTWKPIFDSQSSYSIGCVTIDPSNSQVIWVGTGENVGGRHVGIGDGVYRSVDGGGSWTRMGLEHSEHIGRIVVDPRDSNVVYVAAQGPLWSPGGERGLYRTIDGGATWKQVLAGGEYTGVNDVVLDPRNPDLLYAATHQRFRNVAALVDGGPESGIHKSTDGGATWRKLGTGLPEGEVGRIGLAISPQNPDVVYATIELAHRKGGFWRSPDRGESWEKRSDSVSGGTGPHYYQEIMASPHAFDRVYQMNVAMQVSDDGGKTFRPVGLANKHSDEHALAFVAGDPNYLLTGTDGGLYESWDLGVSWRYVANLPVTQFYKVAVDSDTPFYNIYGGTQDNSTQGGPSRTDNTSGIRNSDWSVILFADGHQPAVDPDNPDIVYCEWQQGNLMRYDRTNGELVYLQPQPEPGDPPERFNWDAPILVSPHDPARLYYASQRVWRSDDRGDSWTPISPDLTRGINRLEEPMMGRRRGYDAVWDMIAMSDYGTITSLAESPLAAGLLYAGSDDGLLQVSEDGGGSWRAIEVGSLPGVPAQAFINDIKADLHDADTVYVALDNHKAGDFKPYLVRSKDRGRSWQSIAGDLPDRNLVWRLVQDYEKPELLFLGTEYGLYFSIDAGGHWLELQGGMPTIPVRDLAIQRRENDLVAASFGRGFFILDDYTPLRAVSEEVLSREAELFPARDAWWYMPRRPLGHEGSGSQGGAYYTAENPPFGAVFTYYLRDGLETRKQQRQRQEKKIAEQGGDVDFPTWEEINSEAWEEEPVIVLTVRDGDGQVVRRVTGPAGKGFHRVAWDLRYPSPQALGGPEVEEWRRDEGKGVLAAPGTYSVSLAKRVDGVMVEMAGPQAFAVVPLREERALPGAAPAERTAFMLRLSELRRTVSGAEAAMTHAFDRIGLLKQALLATPAGVDELGSDLQAIEQRLHELQLTLSGDRQKGGLGEPTVPSIGRRLDVVATGNMASTYGPTPTHRRSLEIAELQLGKLREQLHQLIDVDLVAVEQRMEEAGAPWTPGRAVPELP